MDIIKKPHGPPEESKKRISSKDLEYLRNILSPRDIAILNSLATCKYLNTGQVQRLHIYSAASINAGIRATLRNLNKLVDYGLAQKLDRRVGGVRAGSSAFVWYITEAGRKLLNADPSSENTPRKRFYEPSITHLNHTLAISDCYVQIMEIVRGEKASRLGIRIKLVEFEPNCWRQFKRVGRNISLKPDLYLKLESAEYEDCWFIEIDLATESIPTVIEKCNRYHDYYATGKEQEKSKIFPFVLWIVPDEKRKEKLISCLKHNFSAKPLKFFMVITDHELEETLLSGGEGKEII